LAAVPQARTPVRTDYEAGWAADSVWTFCPCRNPNPGLVTIPTTPVAYPGIFSGWGGEVQQIQLRTERMGIWGW